jgi:N-acetylglucosaminyldiphosphoundecaprenol N-acetyl-beta-D-mannosaminyltransferase
MTATSTRVVVLGVPVDALTVEDLQTRLLGFVSDDRRATVLHANVHAINLACRHDWFAAILQRADVVFCDGHGVMLGARILGQRLPARITYADWMWQLAAWSEAQSLSIFLLGASPGVTDRAAARLKARHPRLRIAGWHHGYFDKAADHPDSLAVVNVINTSRPDIVVVGFGMPLQERWIADHRRRIQAPVVLSGGAVFDYVSGDLRRAPAWMAATGFEWLGRLLIEPRRLFSRYVVGNPLFLTRVVWQRVRRGAG